MQELEKESSESGEAIPGSLIKPFLNSHPHKLCQEAPQSYSSVKLFPGSHKGSWQGQMSNLSCRLAHAGLGLMYSCHLLLISSVGSFSILSFTVPIFA